MIVCDKCQLVKEKADTVVVEVGERMVPQEEEVVEVKKL